MKAFRFLFIIILLSTYNQSCKKVEDVVDQFTQFDMTFDEEFTLPEFPIIISEPTRLSLFSDIIEITPLETNIDDVLPGHDTTKDLIEEVKLSEASFKIILPENATFSFLKSVKFYLSAEGLDEVLVASNTDVSESIGNELFLNVEDQDLTEYLKKDEINYDIEIATDEPITEEMNLIIHMVFSIDAKVLGV